MEKDQDKDQILGCKRLEKNLVAPNALNDVDGKMVKRRDVVDDTKVRLNERRE